MRALVRDAMHEGAVGVSTALQYPPAPYARTAELVALAAEAAKLGGVYATHLRSEGDQIDQAIGEAITIGREARIPVEIWHLKVAGKRNWGRMPHVVAKIDSARKAGVDIAADTYAYPAWFNSMSAFVPPWAHDGGTAKLVDLGLAADASFLSDARKRCASERRLAEAIDRARSEGGPIILLAHSLGSLVAYDYLSTRTDTVLVNRLVTIGSMLGSPFPPAVYIGHPGWKRMGARSGYSVLNGAFFTLVALSGLIGSIARVIPIEAGRRRFPACS